MTPTKLLLDADMLLFQSSVSVEQLINWYDDVWTYYSDLNDAIAKLTDTLARLEEDTGISLADMTFCLSDQENFRFGVSANYKSNRKNTRKPMCYSPLKAWLEEHYHCASYPKLEGDDVIGILSDPETTGIWSGDKDLKQISGYHWDGDSWEFISEADGDRFFYYQVLVGDRVDGYGGCPGVGDVRANRILDENCSWEAVVAPYEKKGLTEADAVCTAQMARILRPGEYDFQNEEPILWTP